MKLHSQIKINKYRKKNLNSLWDFWDTIKEITIQMMEPPVGDKSKSMENLFIAEIIAEKVSQSGDSYVHPREETL